MTASSRIAKVICPCCKGAGLWPGMDCTWCGGARRVAPRMARNYANNLYTIAVGGYVYGDHDIKDRDRMTAEAFSIFKLLRETPPWLRA